MTQILGQPCEFQVLVEWRNTFTELAQKLGQHEAVHRDSQAKSWASLQLLGQPCNFYVAARWGPSAHSKSCEKIVRDRIDLDGWTK